VGPLGVCAVVVGVVSVLMLWMQGTGAYHPPAALAGPLAYCAMLMGVGLLFYAKGTSGTGLAKGASAVAIVLGIAGSMMYAKQTVEWRRGTEGRELENVQAIAKAAVAYAVDKGTYPPGFAEMLGGKYLEPERLLSPFAGAGTEYLQKNKITVESPEGRAAVAAHADYTYVGGDLKGPVPAEVGKRLIVVYKTEPVMRVHFAAGYADGSGKYLTLEEAQKALEETNGARKELGVGPLERPEAIERAEEAEKKK
jgi:hypothetical protein